MQAIKPSMLAAAIVLFAATSALAGAPLKGVDVKLGKNPGGSPVSRTTDTSGVANFGPLAAGDYTVEVSGGPPAKILHLQVSGTPSGMYTHEIVAPRDASSGMASGRRVIPFVITAGGRQPVVVTITGD